VRAASISTPPSAPRSRSRHTTTDRSCEEREVASSGGADADDPADGAFPPPGQYLSRVLLPVAVPDAHHHDPPLRRLVVEALFHAPPLREGAEGLAVVGRREPQVPGRDVLPRVVNRDGPLFQEVRGARQPPPRRSGHPRADREGDNGEGSGKPRRLGEEAQGGAVLDGEDAPAHCAGRRVSSQSTKTCIAERAARLIRSGGARAASTGYVGPGEFLGPKGPPGGQAAARPGGRFLIPGPPYRQRRAGERRPKQKGASLANPPASLWAAHGRPADPNKMRRGRRLEAAARSPPPVGEEDVELLAPVEPPFSPPFLFVCTYEAELSNLATPHAALIRRLEPRGAVKALNCNFGHKAQPGYERFLKSPPPRPEGGWALRPGVEAAGDDPPPHQLAPAMVKQRKLQGDGTCFNSAIEAIIIPGPDDAIPAAVRQVLATHAEKHYAVKSFPTTGKTQVPGVLDAGLADGAYISRLWAQYLTEEGAGAVPGLPVAVRAEKPIMQNFKFHLQRLSPRIIIDLHRLVGRLEELKNRQQEAEEGPGEPGALPYPIRELKHAQDNQNISFKFQVAREKKVRVNVFFRGKVNILGAGDPQSAQQIYDFLTALLRDHWTTFVVIRPLSDQDRAARRARRARPPLRLPLEALGLRPPPDFGAILALAESFERDAGGLDDPGVDEVEGHRVEAHQEDPLDDDP